MSTSLAPHQEHVLFDSAFASPTDETRGKLLLTLIAVLAAVALCLSSYLSWTTWSASPVVGCGTDGIVSCDHVLASQWSKWLGLPVSFLGALTYLGILAACWATAKQDASGLALTTLLALSMLAAGSAVWFVGLQMFMLESYCLYCMGTHACGMSIGAMTLLLVRESTSDSKEEQMRSLLGVAGVDSPASSPAVLDRFHPLVATAIASVGLTLLMGGQYFFQPAGLVIEQIAAVPETDQRSATNDVPAEIVEEAEPEELSFESTADVTPTEPASVADVVETDPEAVEPTERVKGSRLIKFGGLPEAIDTYNVPLLGDPEAKHVLVEMIDYTCMHCRNLHPHVHAALERYGNQIAFAVCHTPLSKKCNPYVSQEQKVHMYACEYARLAMGVWQLDRSKFGEFHDWLMESKRAPSIFQAREHAMRLVGEQVLLDESLKVDAYRSFADHSDTMNELKSGLPILLTEAGVIRGIPKSEEEWFKFLEAQLNIKPLAAETE